MRSTGCCVAPKALGWKAFSLRWPYQLFLIGFSALLLAAIEIMRQTSNHQQGLAYFQNPDDITMGVHILYNYFPTICAVIYSILWSFVDSDAKRLEPYFQMSLDKSLATNLLLDYTFHSVFTVPTRAFKNRHWILLAISTTYLAVSLVLPGSMGALISLDEVLLHRESIEFQILGSVHGPHDFYEGDFLNRARAIIASRGRDLPSWTTLDYAVQPFETNANIRGQNDTWTANTTVAYAEPRCSRMEVSNWTMDIRCCVYQNEYLEFYSLYYSADLGTTEEDVSPCQMSLSLVQNKEMRDAIQSLNSSSVVDTPYTSGRLGRPTLAILNLTNTGTEKQLLLPKNGETNMDSVWLRDQLGYNRTTASSCPVPSRMNIYWETFYDDSLRPKLVDLLYSHQQAKAEFGDSQQQAKAEFGDSQQQAKAEFGVYHHSVEGDAAQILSDMITVKFNVYICTTEFYSSPAEVTVRGSDKSVLEVRPSSEKTALTEHEFNRTNFEAVVDYSTIDSIANELNMTYRIVGDERPSLPRHPRNVTHLDPETLGTWAIPPLSSFSTVALEETRKNFNISYELDSTKTELESLEKTYRIVFAAAFSDLLQSYTQRETITGSTDQRTVALVVTAYFAVASECLLACSILTLLLSMLRYSRCGSILRSDPDSLSAQCSFITDCLVNQDHLKRLTANLDYQPTSSIQQVFRTAQLELDKTDNTLEVIETPKPAGGISAASDQILNIQPGRADKIPFFVRKIGALITITVLLVITGALIFLRVWVSRLKGFRYQQDLQAFQSQLVWSFAPALLATYIEACWVSFHRDLSVLEPWVRLRSKVSASQSMALKYSSRPPFLVLVLSLRRKHFLISFLSGLCISTSILNVSMAGLFTQSYVSISESRSASLDLTTTNLPAGWAGILDRTQHDLPWVLLYNNYTSHSKLASWTDQMAGYVPVSDEGDNVESEDYVLFSSTTLGFEASLECEMIHDSDELRRAGLGVWTEMLPGSNSTLHGRIRYLPRDSAEHSLYACEAPFIVQRNLPLSFFHLSTMVERAIPIDSELSDLELAQSSNQGVCDNELVFSYTDVQKGDVEHYICQPQMSVDYFDVTYDNDGVIASATKSNSRNSSIIQNVNGFRDTYAQNFLFNAVLFYGETSMGAFDWPGLLMTILRRNETSLSVPEAMGRVFKEGFSQWLLTRFLVPSFDLEYESNQTRLAAPAASVTYRERRIVPSIPAFGISITLMIMYLAGYIFILKRRRHRYSGPRMPKAIGSLIPWVIHSRMLEDFRGLHNMNSAERDEIVSGLGRIYEFGRFRDRNGKVRLGIELEELILANGGFGDF